MVQEEITGADLGKKINATPHGSGQEWDVGRIFEIRAIEAGQRHEVGQTECTMYRVAVVRFNLQVGDEECRDTLRHGAVDSQVYHLAEAALAYPLFDRRKEIVSLILLDLHIGVAGDPKGVAFDDGKAGEEGREMCSDQLFDPDKAGLAPGVSVARRRAELCGEWDEPWQYLRHLHAGKELALLRVA